MHESKLTNSPAYRRLIRESAREFLREALKDGPFETSQLYEGFQTVQPELCNDSLLCECRGRRTDEPEWKDNLRFALDDLRRWREIKRVEPSGWQIGGTVG